MNVMLTIFKAKRAEVLAEIATIDRAIGAEQPDPIYAAIEAYRRARATADDLEKAYVALRERHNGSSEEHAAWQVWNAAWDEQNRALSALAHAVPTTTAGALAAVAFLQSYLLAVEEDPEGNDQAVTADLVGIAGVDSNDTHSFSTLFLETIAIGLDNIVRQTA